MSLTGALENQNIGGGGWGGGFGGGIGGVGLVGLVGLNNLFDRSHGRGGDDCCNDGISSLNADGIAAKTALLVNQNADQNALLQALADNKNQTIAEGRALGAAVCESEKTTLNQFYTSAIQAANNTQSIKDQATGFAIVNDKRFDDVTTQIANTTAAILSRINDVENQNLRDQLFESRRGRDKDGIEISIQNSNAQAQAQAQLQYQKQDADWNRRFDAILGSFNQLNRNTQDVINFGTMAASANQANQQTNVK